MGATIRYMKKIRSDGDASMCAIGTSMPRHDAFHAAPRRAHDASMAPMTRP